MAVTKDLQTVLTRDLQVSVTRVMMSEVLQMVVACLDVVQQLTM
jgi:hypothetical protein